MGASADVAAPDPPLVLVVELRGHAAHEPTFTMKHPHQHKIVNLERNAIEAIKRGDTLRARIIALVRSDHRVLKLPNIGIHSGSSPKPV
ncbi:hypothetical protein [Bradyrhizobium liaoningense]